ncbi:MAG: efflux RND transporter periplasmic adaptor subunit [Proteobacteria bacterium]|nr:efflux RND transporter periplasmic adaptor subunit [Pseudomonadota bacterium]
MFRSWLIVIVLCLVAAAGLGYFKYQQILAGMAMAAAFPEPAESTEAFNTREELWQPTMAVTAEVLATRAVDLSAELAGTISEVGFAPGEQVTAGQLLVRFDTSEEQAQLVAARADAEIARLDLSRNQQLISKGAAAEEARDRAKARHDAALAAVERLRAVIQKKTLRAPFDAQAGLHQLEPGQYLDKGNVVAHLVGSDEQVWIDFALPQEHAHLNVGEVVQVTLGPEAHSVAAPIIARDSSINQRSRNVKFRALADNHDLRAVAGSLANVEVPVGEARLVALVPVTAVRKDAFGAKVFVLTPAEEGARAPERAEQRGITLGPQRGEYVIVVKGLRVGERIASTGAFKLRHGVLVNAREASTATALSQPSGDDT